jgi:hypothetical protein
VHKTPAGERIKTLKMAALELAKQAAAAKRAAKVLPDAEEKARELQREANKAHAEALTLKLQARLEDLNVWKMEKTTTTKKGSRKYTYWMASWREGDRVRNVHIGSTSKMDAEQALKKAQKMKAKAIQC